MSLRSPLGRVLGTGAAREGVSHWWLQRLTAVALVPLTLWFLYALMNLDVSSVPTMTGWLALPWHALCAALLVVVLCLHSHLGVQVVVEDYVHHAGLKLVTLVLAGFAHVFVGAAGVFAILRIALVGPA